MIAAIRRAVHLIAYRLWRATFSRREQEAWGRMTPRQRTMTEQHHEETE